MTDGPVIETERLILRPPRLEDLDGWAAFMADEEASRHLGGVQGRSGAWRSHRLQRCSRWPNRPQNVGA